ncbi:DUF4352 domain-containing protein [Paraliobacillus sediminis]|uniref:DUF4352 domain-containing protein n=1 Tax=Paraliobacillus sediminis TaxID=1885916 RepID=UPI000E3C2B3D|nr:DUF4352 domain-containing protein [Paraliobacillus sediminis]
MKNLIKLIVTGMVIAFVLVGCNNDDEANETSENQETEDSNEASETAGEAETDEAEGEESTSEETDSSESKGEILSLGETGTMETILGDFEVTPTGVKFLEEIEDGGSNVEPSNEVFIVVDVTVKNIGDEAFESGESITADLFDMSDAGLGNTPGYSSVEDFDGEVAPGEEVSGQLIFDFWETDPYILIFGYGYTSDLSNEVTWEFTADEAE